MKNLKEQFQVLESSVKINLLVRNLAFLAKVMVDFSFLANFGGEVRDIPLPNLSKS